MDCTGWNLARVLSDAQGTTEPDGASDSSSSSSGEESSGEESSSEESSDDGSSSDGEGSSARNNAPRYARMAQVRAGVACTAAVPVENPYCSCGLHSCSPYGESLLQLWADREWRCKDLSGGGGA